MDDGRGNKKSCHPERSGPSRLRLGQCSRRTSCLHASLRGPKGNSHDRLLGIKGGAFSYPIFPHDDRVHGRAAGCPILNRAFCATLRVGIFVSDNVERPSGPRPRNQPDPRAGAPPLTERWVPHSSRFSKGGSTLGWGFSSGISSVCVTVGACPERHRSNLPRRSRS